MAGKPQKTSGVASKPKASPDKPDLRQIGARVTAANYLRLKALAAMQDTTVQALVEQAIADFLAANQ